MVLTFADYTRILRAPGADATVLGGWEEMPLSSPP